MIAVSRHGHAADVHRFIRPAVHQKVGALDFPDRFGHRVKLSRSAPGSIPEPHLRRRAAHPCWLPTTMPRFLNIIFILTGMLTVLISIDFLDWTGLDRPEYYMLMLFSIAGMMLMGMGNDLILIFLALELLSIPLYIMAALAWPRPDSEESAMKYFLLGAFSSAIFVFGIALLYGATGTTALPAIVAALGEATSLLALAGTAFLLVGFGFKIAAVPFQMWTPDVYEGAPDVGYSLYVGGRQSWRVCGACCAFF